MQGQLEHRPIGKGMQFIAGIDGILGFGLETYHHVAC
jgi:hypothetical protein